MQKLPIHSIKQAISSKACYSLRTRGYAVIDNVFGEEWCEGFKSEIKHLHENNLMFSNATHLRLTKENRTVFVDKRNIFEMELIPDIYEIVPDYLQCLDQSTAIIEALNENMSDVNIVKQAIKMQYNAGSGACFPIHADSDPFVDPRIISSILYLNPTWKSGDGGELKLYPFPYEPVLIEPKMDRFVLFSSSKMLHRVMPSNSTERYCMTLWYSQPNFSPPAPLQRQPENQSEEAIMNFLLQPRIRSTIAKLVYADEWRDSIIDSHEDSSERQILLDTHQRDVEKIRSMFKDYLQFIQEKFPVPAGTSANNLINWL